MAEFLIGSIIFTCGGFFGFIAAAFFASGYRDDDFDGGFRHQHRADEPRAHTTIYSHDITEEKL